MATIIQLGKIMFITSQGSSYLATPTNQKRPYFGGQTAEERRLSNIQAGIKSRKLREDLVKKHGIERDAGITLTEKELQEAKSGGTSQEEKNITSRINSKLYRKRNIDAFERAQEADRREQAGEPYIKNVHWHGLFPKNASVTAYNKTWKVPFENSLP